MGIARTCVTVAIGALLCASLASAAPTQDSSAVLYSFAGAPNALEVGCQGPCECAVVPHPLAGSFVLVPAGSDPLFRNYDVQRFEACVDDGAATLPVRGSGHYRIGGEVAVTHQMTLDLVVGSQPQQHFDSGIVPVRAPFPEIYVACALHGFYCLDSVFVLQAKPDPASVSSARAAPPGLRWVRPNPSRAGAEIDFLLARAGPAELSIVDVSGRRVRTLTAEAWMAAGDHEVAWDGKLDDGRAARAGLYWVRVVSPDGSDRRQIVKLR